MNDLVQFKYCIPCEQEVDVIDGEHTRFAPAGSGWEQVGMPCRGPFENIAPPEFTDEIWEAIFSAEPTNDESDAILEFEFGEYE